jgi:8-oxo-dGTP pyrophosphatase MutT (NUDIX family)
MNDSVAANTALLTEDHLSRTSEKRHPTRSPRDAASLILMDRSGKVPRALLGKRGKAHAFMPDLYVFPGGRRDPGDNRVRLARPLRDEVFDKLMVRTQSRFRDPAARGLAVAAAREMMEEAHLSLTPAEYADPCARMSRSSAFSPGRSHLRARPAGSIPASSPVSVTRSGLIRPISATATSSTT